LAKYCFDLTKLLNHLGRATDAAPWYAAAVDARQSLVRAEPTNARYRFLLAHSYFYGGETPAADPSGDPQKRYRQAIELFAALVDEAPESFNYQSHLAEACNGLAIFLASSGRGEEAVQNLRRNIEQMPGGDDGSPRRFALALVRAQLALQLAVSGRGSEAVLHEVQEASRLAPSGTAIQLVCGDAAALAGSWDKAVEHYRRADELCGHSWWTMRYLAALRLAAGDVAGYRSLCIELVERSETSATPRQAGLFALTCALDALPQAGVKPALDLARQSVAAQPKNATSLAALGCLLRHAGELDEAERVLVAALELCQQWIPLANDNKDELRVVQIHATRSLAITYRDLGRMDALQVVLADLRRQASDLKHRDLPDSGRIAPWSFRRAVELAELEFSEHLTPEATTRSAR
jgi:tetratricopeptide (TPR) repeat protein